MGIAKAEPTPKEKTDLESWLMQGHHATMEWIVKRKKERGDIQTYFPEAKSVISIGLNYFVGKDQSNIHSDYLVRNQSKFYTWLSKSVNISYMVVEIYVKFVHCRRNWSKFT